MVTEGYHLEFERPIVELERRLAELRRVSRDNKKVNFSAELLAMEHKLTQLKSATYASLTAWQRVQLARHPQRPFTLDYIQLLFEGFVELHGDRLFGDDKAIVGGLATFEGQPLLVLGHQKGRDTKENLRRNFGSAHPEGYRKALRLMQLAAKRRLPILIFIDTPGAYPGIGAEERGQAHSIACNLREMMRLESPILIIVIGEGGSGGALGIGVGDRVCILEHAYYSVISPEGCAAILWKDRKRAPEAAEALKLTAQDLVKAGFVDESISEPLGGAHRDPSATAAALKPVIRAFLEATRDVPPDILLQRRYQRFRRLGVYEDSVEHSLQTPRGEPSSHS